MCVNKIKLGIFKPCLYGDGGGSPLNPCSQSFVPIKTLQLITASSNPKAREWLASNEIHKGILSFI